MIVFVVIEFDMLSVVCVILISGLIEIKSVVIVMGKFMVGSIIRVVKVVLLFMFVILKELMVIIVISDMIKWIFSGLILMVGVIIIVNIVG